MVDHVAGTAPDPMQFETAQLRKFADLCPTMFCVTQIDGRIECVNPAFLATLGYDRDDVVSASLLGLIHPMDRDASRQAFSPGETSSVSRTVDNRCRRKDGRYCELSWQTMYEPDTDRILAIAREIPGRTAGLSGSDSNKLTFNEYAMDNAADPIYWLDRHGKNIYVNDAACKSLGYASWEMLELSVSDYDCSFPKSGWNEAFRKLSTGELTNFESVHRRSDGDEFPVEVSLSVVTSEGEDFICAFVRDISERKAVERQMAELKFAIENAYDAVYLTGENGDIIYANRSACESLGYSSEELTTLNVVDIDPTLTPQLATEIRDQQQSGERRTVETIHRRKDGSTFPVELTFNNTSYQGHEFSCSFVRDISERKKEAWQTELLRFGLENAVDAVYIADQNSKIVYVNQTACRMLGYRYNELLSMTVYDVDPLATKERMAEGRRRAEMGEPTPFESVHRRKDGITIPVEVTVSVRNFEGVEFACGIVRDISERKKAERHSAELRFAVENAVDPVYLNDREGNIYYANRSACQSLGYSFDELTSMNVADIDSGFSRQTLIEFLDGVKTDVSLNQETVHRRKDGSTFPVQVTFNCRECEGVEFFCSFIRDISERKETERLNEELRFVIDNAMDAVYIYTHDGTIRYANESASEQLGYSREELLNMRISDLDPFINEQARELNWQESVKGTRVVLETLHRRKDGTSFPVEISHGATVYEGIEYAGAFVRNIEERKAAESRMQMLNFAIENVSDSMYIYGEDALILYVNKSASRATGYSRDELTSMQVFDLAPSVNPEKWKEQWHEAWESKNRGESRLFESYHKRKDGSTYPIEISVSYAEFEEAKYAFAFVRDISDRKEATRKMEELRFAIDNAVDPIYLLDKDAHIYYANKRACNVLGYNYDELTRLTVFDLDPYCTEQMWQSTWSEGHMGVLESIESHHCKKDGSVFPVEVSISNNVYDGFAYSCTVARDITDRKETEMELRRYQEHLQELVASRTKELEAAQEELVRKERLAVLGQLTGIVGHELRNPLGTIRTSLFVVREQANEEQTPIRKALDRAERNVIRCDKIIDELLDFTRSRPLELEPVNMDDWIAMVIAEYQIPEDVTVETNLNAGVSVNVEADRFRRCVINSLSNACEAMLENPKDRPKYLKISTRVLDNQFEVAIVDTGPGIAEEKLQKIFEPLYSTKGFGIGLGLPIVEQIMKQHHGSVHMSSVVGEGTRISLQLPLDEIHIQ